MCSPLAGRLPVTWYRDSYTQQLPMTDMRMRADGSYPGGRLVWWDVAWQQAGGWGTVHSLQECTLPRAPQRCLLAALLHMPHHVMT